MERCGAMIVCHSKGYDSQGNVVFKVTRAQNIAMRKGKACTESVMGQQVIVRPCKGFVQKDDPKLNFVNTRKLCAYHLASTGTGPVTKKGTAPKVIKTGLITPTGDQRKMRSRKSPSRCYQVTRP
jgi:hypothetical protein